MGIYQGLVDLIGLVCVGGAVAMTPVSYTRQDAALRAATVYDPDWRSRYAEAYRRQNKAFVHFAQTGRFSPIAADAWDGYAAAVVAEAGVRALRQGGKVAVQMAERPALYGGA